MKFGGHMEKVVSIARKHSLCALLTLLTDIAFFLAAAYLLERAFHHYLFDRVLYTIIPESLGNFIELMPGALKSGGESSFALLLKPLILYLAWQIALNLSTIVTGLFNTKLSDDMEASAGLPPKTKGFSFVLGQDLLMLAFTIVWSAALFLLPHYGILPAGVAEIAFWVFTPFIYALYNLSYTGLPRGVTYAAMLRIAFTGRAADTVKPADGQTRMTSRSQPLRFIRFVYASALGPFLLLFLLSRVDWSSAAFIILFGVSAIFRAFGVILGTNFAASLAPFFNIKRLVSPILAYGTQCAVFVLAICIVITGVQVMGQADSKLELLKCRYRIVDAGLNLPEVKDAGSLLNRIVGVLSFTSGPSAYLSLEVTNPGERTIYVNDMKVAVYLYERQIAETSISGFVLGPGAKTIFSCRAEIDGINIAKSFPHILSSGLGLNLGGAFARQSESLLPIELRGTLMLNTWLGEIPYPLRITPR